LQRFEEVRQLHAQGISLRAIARRLNIERETVRRFVRAEVFPEWRQSRRRRKTDQFLGYLKKRWEEGCHNAAQIARELASEGFKGSYHSVRWQMARWRHRPTAPDRRARPTLLPLSSRRLAWLLLKSDTDRTSQESLLIQALEEQSLEIKEMAEIGRQFTDLVRRRRPGAWEDWLARARAPTAIKELRAFAAGLQEDESAVKPP
jgi:transposase